MSSQQNDVVAYMNSPRVDLSKEKFNTLVYQKGTEVIWEQGMFCSCYDRESGQPNYHCPTCRGKGYVYFNPSKTRSLVTSIRGNKSQHSTGLDETGTAYLTPLSTDLMGFRDRITFLNFTTKYSQVVYTDGSGMDKLRYKSLQVVCLRSLDKLYMEGEDFTIEEFSLIWKTTPPAYSYSILYLINPVYIIMSPIHELRGSFTAIGGKGLEVFQELNKQFQLKREDFLPDDFRY